MDEKRKIASVRIHVELVIGLVRRKYVILKGILPIEFLKAKSGGTMAPIDKIARVLSDSIIPFD